MIPENSNTHRKKNQQQCWIPNVQLCLIFVFIYLV